MLILLCAAISCSRESSIRTLAFSSTPVISTAERFALLVDPYISMRDQPGEDGITIAHGRRGEIYPVNGKRIIQTGKSNVIWIDLGSGWVPETTVQLYSSQEKAHTAAALLE